MYGTEPSLDDLDPRITVRRIPRESRNEKPGWEILLVGEPMGKIYQTRIGRSQSRFYEAIARFPGTEELVSPELSTSFSERCDKLIAFHRDPGSSIQLPRHL